MANLKREGAELKFEARQCTFVQHFNCEVNKSVRAHRGDWQEDITKSGSMGTQKKTGSQCLETQHSQRKFGLGEVKEGKETLRFVISLVNNKKQTLNNTFQQQETHTLMNNTILP